MPFIAQNTWPAGCDDRATTDTGNPKSIRTAINLDLKTDGTVWERDGMKPIATMDSNSVGLYTVNGVLRSVIPGGHSLRNSQMADGITLAYDAVGDGTIYGFGTIIDVPSVSSWGADPASGVYPYIVIKRSNLTYEHHWITHVPVPTTNGAPPPPYLPSNTAVNTKVSLPFPPGASILKLQSKIYGIDNTNGVLRFSSTANGPSDWTLQSDAGFLAVLQNVTGDRNMTALGFYDTQAAVFFSDSIQLWQLYADPGRDELVRVLPGPGTIAPRAVSNVRGDTFYFSRGTVSSLRKVARTGQLQDGDIGAPIADTTRQYTGVTPIAIWSQTRSQYIIAFGTNVWLYTTSPVSKVTGWTQWQLPVTVDFMVELDGQLYIRSANTLYRMTAGYADGTSFTFQPQFITCGNSKLRKLFSTMSVSMFGAATITFLDDVRDPTITDAGFTADGVTGPLDDIYVGITTEAICPQFTGLIGANPNQKFKLDGFNLKYSVLKR